MLTAEERGAFEKVLWDAHRTTERSTEVEIILDALEALPEGRCVPHLAYLLQHFWDYPAVQKTESITRATAWAGQLKDLLNDLIPKITSSLMPSLRVRPTVEEMAQEIWTLLQTFSRPEKDVALSIVIVWLVPYGCVPEPGEFGLTVEEYDELLAANKPDHATARTIANVITSRYYPKTWTYFASVILACIKDKPPKEQSALLATFLGRLEFVRTPKIVPTNEPPTPQSPPDDDPPN